MEERARDLVDDARERREAGDLIGAGDAYTAAAHEYAGTVREHSFPEPDLTRGTVSRLCYAATCYRIAGDEFRVQNRCELGTLLAEDYLDYIDGVEFEDGSFADLRRGAWPEFVGDLRTIAGRDDAGDAYDEAVAIYDAAGDWEFVLAEQEHSRLAGYFRSVRRGLGHDIPVSAPEQEAMGITFAEWVEDKRERLPGLLEELEAAGDWPVG